MKYTKFPWKIFYFHLQSSSTSRKWKNSNVVRFADPEDRVRRDPSVTLRKFSSDSIGHDIRITKHSAVWYFPFFSLKDTNFYSEILYLYLESSSASRKWKNSNVVLFADPAVHSVCTDPRKYFSTDSTGQNFKYSKETVKWRMANVFTVKQTTICPGWLPRKTILEGFQ